MIIFAAAGDIPTALSVAWGVVQTAILVTVGMLGTLAAAFTGLRLLKRMNYGRVDRRSDEQKAMPSWWNEEATGEEKEWQEDYYRRTDGAKDDYFERGEDHPKDFR